MIPNGTISNSIEPEWKYFALAVGTVEGKDRIAFFVRNIFSYNNDILRFQGVELRYNATNQTLRVVNNGGNLYFVEQYSTLT